MGVISTEAWKETVKGSLAQSNAIPGAHALKGDTRSDIVEVGRWNSLKYKAVKPSQQINEQATTKPKNGPGVRGELISRITVLLSSSFQKRNYKTCKEAEKCNPYTQKRKKQATETACERAQMLVLTNISKQPLQVCQKIF